MKTKAFLLVITIFIFSIGINAQNVVRKTIDDKVAIVMQKFEGLKLDKPTLATINTIFADFYTAQDKIRDNIQRPVSGLAQGFAPQSFQDVRKQNENIINDRDNRLKKALTIEQFKKWTDEIEPSLRSRK